MASGSHCRKGGGALDTAVAGFSIRFRHPSATALYDEQRDGSESDFASIIPPGVGTSVYQGLVSIGMGFCIGRITGIN